MPREIHAPYNFVPLSEEIFQSPTPFDDIGFDKPLADGYCGTIGFTLLTASPLCVGAEREPAKKDRPGEVKAFRTPGPNPRYAIPGSSIRGMVRNVLEILTFGRFAAVDDRRFALRDLSGLTGYVSLVSKSDFNRKPPLFTPKVKAGWLRQDQASRRWLIRPCEFARIEHSALGVLDGGAKYRGFVGEEQSGPKGQPLFNGRESPEKYEYWRSLNEPLADRFVIERPQAHPTSSKKAELFFGKAYFPREGDTATKPGRLVFTGQPAKNKHREFVFYDDAPFETPVDPEAFRNFLDIQGQLADRRAGDDVSAQTAWQYLLNRHDLYNESIPVFFVPDGPKAPIVNFGLSMMFPWVCTQTIHKLRDAHQKAIGQSEPDWAEAIFGRIADADGKGLKGRVSFSLALGPDASGTARFGDAGILAEPKPSYIQAYLEQDPTKGLIQRGHAASYLDQNSRLRGWKRYPTRRDPIGLQAIEPNLQNKRQLQTRLETVPKGSTFTGIIRFHNLSLVELGAVLWAMSLGEPGTADSRNPYCHNVGLGKPWGYGQVKLRLTPSNSCLIPNDLKAKPPTMPEARAAFVGAMDVLCEARFGQSWSETLQVRTLLAMADPANATKDNPPSAGPLLAMSLPKYSAEKTHKHDVNRPERHNPAPALRAYKARG